MNLPEKGDRDGQTEISVPHSSSNKEDPESTTSPSGPSGRVTGQGSHFAREEETTSSGYLPGTDAKQSAGTTSGENIGTAAIGETSTYSSHNLRKGDPIGNVADISSNDPTTYRMPEHTYGSSNTGVPAGAASTAASLAFNKDQDSSHIPGAFPDDDTSTSDSARGAASAAASGMTGTQSGMTTGTQSGMTGTQSRMMTGTQSGREPYGSRGLEAATGGAAGTEAEREPYGSSGLGQGLSTGGDDTATETETHQHPFTSSGLGTAHDATTIAPSGQTPSAYPADRTGDYSYSTAEGSRAPYETGPSQSSTANTSTAAEGPKHSGTFGKILGGLGLGAAAGGATGAATRERESDKPGVVSETRDQPTTTTGLSSYNAPTRSEPTTGSEQSPSHHRKESIPTTAYPAGQRSPAPISSPVGGTTAAVDEAERKDHTGRNVGMAGAGLGAGALGAHEYEKHRSQPGDTTKYSNAPFGQQTTSEAPYAPATSSTGTARDIDRKPVASTPYTDSAPEKESRGYGKTATAAGLGAGAAGAGAYAMEHERNRPETGDLRADKPYSGSGTAAQPSTGATQMPFREKTTTTHIAGTSAERPRDTKPATQVDDRHTGRDAALAGAAGTGAGAYGTHEYDKHRAEQDPLTSRHEPVPSTKETRTTAPAATSEKTARTYPTTEQEHDKSHTGRDAALVGAAGAGAGAGAYGMHEHNQHEAEEAEARRQKDLAEQEEARQNQYEKDQKAAEKLAHKEEKQHEKDIKKDHKLAAKEEKKHQKEIEKEEKHHQKEVEKENKHHEKEVAAAETEHHKQLEKEEKARREAEEAERHRHEKEGVAAAAAGTGAAAYGVHEHDKNKDTQQLPSKHEQDSAGEGRPAVVSDETGHNVLHKDPPQEKKPGFFKRIFKRRKNKDTGLDEDYSTDEEDHTHHGRHAAEAGAVGAGAGAGVAGAEATHHGHHEPGTATSTTTSTDHHLSSYEEQTGGLQKPSYNPFSKRDHTGATPVTATHGADSHLGAGVGANQYDGSYETRPVGASTGMRETGPAGAGTAGMHDTTTSAEAGTGTYATRPTETAAATSGAIDPENIGGVGGR